MGKNGNGISVSNGNGIEWDENGNEVTEMGGNWDEKSIPAHLYTVAVRVVSFRFTIR